MIGAFANQPEIGGGPWWIVNSAGKRVGAVYSWPPDDFEVWFTVVNANNNNLYANWPSTDVADVHFVTIVKADDVVAPGSAQEPWVMGPPTAAFNRLPRQNPQVTYEVWKHTIVKSTNSTW